MRNSYIIKWDQIRYQIEQYLWTINNVQLLTLIISQEDLSPVWPYKWVTGRWRRNHSLLTEMLLSKPNLPSCLNGFLGIFSQPRILSKSLLVTLAVTHEEGDIQVEQFTKWTEWSQVWSLAAESENYNTRATAHEKPDPLSIPMTSLCATGLLPGGEREHNLISNNCNPRIAFVAATPRKNSCTNE